ncbi:MAG: DUF3373 family protein [Thermodesulfobacteriota bacterium]|nr:DUF3373 family protein [Thermodesulfobacteriota bacterium]
MIRILIKLFAVFVFGVFVLSVSAQGIHGQGIEILQEDISEMSDRLDKVETKSILDRVIVGGEFRTRVDYFRYEDTTASLDPTTIGAEHDSNTKDIWTNRLRFNLEADITDNLAFYAWLTYFKLWGEAAFDRTPLDINYTSIPDSEGGIHIERAYFEYVLPDLNLCLTAGRLPTTEGPPGELRENRARKATWGKMQGDLELDGIIVNLFLDEWIDLNQLAIRFIYSKVSQNWLEYRGFDMKDTRVPALVIESEIPRIENSVLQIGYTMVVDFPLIIYDIPGMEVANLPNEEGKLDFLFFHIQMNDINKDGLDWFFSYGHFNTNPPSEGIVFTNGYEIGMFGDNLSGNLGQDRSGYAIYSGVRYKLPIESWKYPKVGFEYTHASKYWLGGFTSSGSGELINKLHVIGDTYELYYIQPLDKKHTFLRIGGIFMESDYENPFVIFGTMSKSEMTVLNGYLLMDVLF